MQKNIWLCLELSSSLNNKLQRPYVHGNARDRYNYVRLMQWTTNICNQVHRVLVVTVSGMQNQLK